MSVILTVHQQSAQRDPGKRHKNNVLHSIATPSDAKQPLLFAKLVCLVAHIEKGKQTKKEEEKVQNKKVPK